MTAIIPADLPDKIRARITVNDSGCWVYPTKAKDGYARVSVRSDSTKSGYTTVRPSRVMYEAEVGPIPEGLELDHVKARGCTSNACCNPAHLEPVTGVENKLRADNPIMLNALKTHCPAGHEYTEENTYRTATGGRLCATCQKDWQKAYRRSKKTVGKTNAEKTHCPKSHEYTPENTYVNPKTGHRICRACQREHDRNRSRSRVRGTR